MLTLFEALLGPRGIRPHLMLNDRWGALTVPTMLLWGEREAFGTLAEAEALASRSDNITLVRIAGAGHLPWIDDPGRVVAEIERFTGERTITSPRTPRVACCGSGGTTKVSGRGA
jgi:pimeloyl-ACP methyl ester carboxylesterase